MIFDSKVIDKFSVASMAVMITDIFNLQLNSLISDALPASIDSQ